MDKVLIAGSILMASISVARAETAPVLKLPVDCEMGQHCFIQKYFDHRRGKSYQDYRCGPLADDAHTGTDFRLPDHAAMARGVAVVAAASGTIRNVRDGMPDVDVRLVGRDAVTDRGLGNVVIVDHGGGWRTIYGHLRRGSVTVSKGQRVATGQKLGLIGLSGITQFPHVHFEVRFAKRSVDPFVGLATHTGCGVGKKVMWHPDLVPRLGYRPTFLLGAALSANITETPAPLGITVGRWR